MTPYVKSPAMGEEERTRQQGHSGDSCHFDSEAMICNDKKLFDS